jgi:hypothetical protein
MEDFQFDFIPAPGPDRERGLRALGLTGSSLLEIMLHKVLLDAWTEENLASGGRFGEPFDEAAAEVAQVLAMAAVLPKRLSCRKAGRIWCRRRWPGCWSGLIRRAW